MWRYRAKGDRALCEIYWLITMVTCMLKCTALVLSLMRWRYALKEELHALSLYRTEVVSPFYS
uniref:Uncharacterized protein n=1 Tax=Hyaloperonospora arabidopsidis (strain Emoy2) TaxID=559515 RepID=M4BN04_HYAAE